jgi:hypothetical protein
VLRAQTGLWGGIPCALLVPFAAVFVPHFYIEQARPLRRPRLRAR